MYASVVCVLRAIVRGELWEMLVERDVDNILEGFSLVVVLFIDCLPRTFF